MIKTYFCPAKINLFLEVTGKRSNGYHELATLFAKINIGDTLTVEAVESPQTHISLKLTGPVGRFLPATPDNLVWKATQAFLDFFNMHATVHLSLEKNTPTGAGLGGGSSDAAYTLRALCAIFKKDIKLLLPLAASLGADVPLFMYEDTFLKGEGIGEILTPIETSNHLPWLVLVYPNTVVPTKGVFAHLTLPSPEKVLTNLSKLDKLIEYLKEGAPLPKWKGLFFNRLEECVLPFTFPVQRTWLDLKQIQGDFVLMSGSGSTVVTFVETEKQAKQLAEKLQCSERTCFATTFYRKGENGCNGN